jgi:hypothetical protein
LAGTVSVQNVAYTVEAASFVGGNGRPSTVDRLRPIERFLAVGPFP